MLLRRAKNLAQSLDNRVSARGDGDPSFQKRPSSTHFSLQTSALSRTVSRRIGRGASCGLLQEVAAAAVSEAGEKNVSASDLSAYRNFACFSSLIVYVGLCPHMFKARGGRPLWVLLADVLNT